MQEYFQFIGDHPFLFIAFGIIVVLLFINLFGSKISGYQSASPADATMLINREEAVFLDVRTDAEYRDGHIVNAINIPQSNLPGRISELDKFKDKPIIVGCKSGSRSGMACSMLKKNGFEHVYNLSGGILAWQNANLPITKK